MLDHIYQQAQAENSPEIFILFTGDAHFNSVASFLKNICKKQVGVYGVKGAFSNQLKETASWWVEIPTEDDTLKIYYDMILKSIKNVENGNNRKQRVSFGNTVKYVSDYYDVDQAKVKDALQSLVDKGYLERREEYLYRKRIMTLHTNWDKLTADGLWKPEPVRKK